MRNAHFASLDWLRGVAALLVLALHLTNPTVAAPIFAKGYLAVDLFFVISGFVIARAYEPVVRRPGGLALFAATRWIRLYPMVALASLIGGVAWSLGQVATHHPLLLMATHLLFIPNWWWGWALFAMNGPQWTLLFEVMANAAHALAVRRLSVRVLCATVGAGWLGLIAAAHHFGSLSVGWGVPNLLGGVARLVFGYGGGVLLFRLHDEGWLRWPAAPGWIVGIMPLLILAPGLAPDRWYIDVAAVSVMPAAVALALGTTLPHALHRAGRALGALSYPLYAIHIPLLKVAIGLFGAVGFSTVQQGIQALMVAAAILVAAWLAERCYDAPVRRWLASRLAVTPVLAPAATVP